MLPTLTFGQTKVEMFLNEHILYGTGFIVELFYRNGTTKTNFVNTETITTSLSGLITMKIEWQFIKSEKTP